MDEGFARKYLGDEYDVHSAGIEAHGVNPKAIEAMKEIGIDISNQESAIIDDEVLKRADAVITLCGDAHGKCPVTRFTSSGTTWELDDPAKADRTDEEQRMAFRRVRDEIEARVKKLAFPRITPASSSRNARAKRGPRIDILPSRPHGGT